MKLPKFLIADLYKEVLVEIGQKNPKNNSYTIEKKENIEKGIDTKKGNTSLKYLGDNNKNIIILVSNSSAIFIEEEDLNFLTNVLKSVELNLADIALINLATTTTTYSDLLETFKAKYFIFFGTTPSSISLPLNVPHFQIQQYAGFYFMTVPSITDLNKPTEEAKLLKTKLWVGLRNMLLHIK